METAYKLNEDGNGYVLLEDGSGRPRIYDAQDFDKNTRPEKGRYVCACCEESIKWMPEIKAEGAFKPRKAHWAAINRDAHIAKGCDAISIQEYDDSLSAKCTENQAINDTSITLLMRINFDTRHGLTAKNQKELTIERAWCRQHEGQYKPKVIHSMDEFVDFINKIVKKAPDGDYVMDRVMVSHGGQTRKLSQVLLLEESQRMAQYKILSRKPWQNRLNGKFISGGFPCVIPFGLAYGEKKEFGSPKRVFNAASKYENLSEAYRTPHYRDSAELVQKSGYVIAWPYLNKRNPGKLMWSIHDMSHVTSRKIDLHPSSAPTPFKMAAE